MKDKTSVNSSIRLTGITILINLLLSALKLVLGLIGHSRALVADAIHSASDVLSSLVVIWALFISRRGPDAGHEYGHQRFESLATLFLSLLLLATGLGIGRDGVLVLFDKTGTPTVPSPIVLIAAGLSILVKEIMFRVTLRKAQQTRSGALKADAYHHRSDAFSSVGSLLGALFAILGLPVMDAIGSLVICVFILKAAIELILEAVRQLTDASIGKEQEEAIRKEILSVEQVLSLDELRTRLFGAGCYVDAEIGVDETLTLHEAHRIAENVHDRIEENFPDVYHCMVHVNPAHAGLSDVAAQKAPAP